MTGRAIAAGLAALLAGCDQPAPEAAPQTPAQVAYAAANARMHEGMATIDRDPDVAFAQGMTAHHRGAVAMAEVELRHGRDPTMRALAQEIIAAQAGEIARMERWLARRGARPAPASAGHAHPSSAAPVK